MNKSLFAVGVALSITSFAFAATEEKLSAGIPEKPEAAEAKEAAEQLEKEEPAWFEAEVTLDLFSAYVWRNAVFNDELVFQPCASFDFTRWQPAGHATWLGGYVWQNWDMTGVRSPTPRAMNETDFNVHFGATAWQSEDEEYGLDLEIGNDFYTYRQQEDCPNSYEFYLKAEFWNPYVSVYGQYAQAYNPVIAPYFELGLKREAKLGEIFDSENDILNRFTLAADWNLSMASGKYFTNYLYGTIPGAYDPEADEYEELDMSNNVGGTTIKGTCFYRVCDHFSIGAVIAFTALLSDEARDAMDYAENGCMYKRLVWGGLQAKFDF